MSIEDDLFDLFNNDLTHKIIVNGQTVLVSLEDAAYVETLSLCLVEGANSSWSVMIKCKDEPLERLHIEIAKRANLYNGETIDHKDGNFLNCVRENLRSATGTQQQGNQKKRKTNRSGYKGVPEPKDGRYVASIMINYKTVPLGRFDTAIEAAKAYDEAAREYFGEFVCVNFPRGNERQA